MSDIVERLVTLAACGAFGSDDAAVILGAADEIERLREERDYLRYELNNETDRYMAMKETNSVHIAEIQRLRMDGTRKPAWQIVHDYANQSA
jgi:hypothetical protein